MELTLIEALCVIDTGWGTEKEKKLFDIACDVVQKDSKRLCLIYKKELIENELEQFKKK